MLGRIPPFSLWIGGPVLVAGVAFAFFHFLISPQQVANAALQTQITQMQQKADQKATAEAERDKTKQSWETSHDQLAQKMDERSIPVSMAHPMVAMVNLWREVREDLPQLVQEHVRRSGCIIVRGHPGWQAPMTPFPASTSWIEAALGDTVDASHASFTPAGAGDAWNPSAARTPAYSAPSDSLSPAIAPSAMRGYMQAPDRLIGMQMPSALQVAGTMESIERLYKSLRTFPRVLTIRHLVLRRADLVYAGDEPAWIADALGSPIDQVMVADIVMSIWILCEAPEAAGGGAAAAGGGAPGGMGGGMMGGMGGAPGGMSGGMMGGPGGGGSSGGAPGAGASKAGGGEKKAAGGAKAEKSSGDE
jgi:uncharacterized membrane protein YgcG